MNEQVLRFLNLRYPRDYNTVPRVYFWLFHLLWLFPWSVYFPAVARLTFRPRGSRGPRAPAGALLGGLCAGLLHLFHHPGILLDAVLSGAGVAAGLGHGGGRRVGRAGDAGALGIGAARRARGAGAVLCGAQHARAGRYLARRCRSIRALTRCRWATWKTSRLQSLAYLRLPLALAGAGVSDRRAGHALRFGRRARRGAFLAAALMMVIFFHAARLAMVAFDPYLSSRPLAEALLRAPQGELVVDHHYYTFSSVFFYTNRSALLLNGRLQNLVYGSYAPGAPDVFLDDARLEGPVACKPSRCYLVTNEAQRPRLERLVGPAALHVVAASGGKLLLSNQEPGPE